MAGRRPRPGPAEKDIADMDLDDLVNAALTDDDDERGSQ